MFERFTEKARRVIFLARYEASQYGSNTIEIEHLLLGALKEDRDLIKRFSGTSITSENIRAEIEKHLTTREKVWTSDQLDLPLSDACKRVLTLAVNECVAFDHPHVGVEHLLLGILRQQTSTASQILQTFGIDEFAVRRQIAPDSVRYRVSVFAVPTAGCVPNAETAIRIAEAVWSPIFGDEIVKNQRPFHAELVNETWTVRGTRPVPTERLLIAQIEKNDGRILKLGQEHPDSL
jgi:NTF2 fold immunity protein/Clp amino terminal domain, pathogenicity island component